MFVECIFVKPVYKWVKHIRERPVKRLVLSKMLCPFSYSGTGKEFAECFYDNEAY